MGSATVAQFHFRAHGDKQVALRLNVANVRNIFQNYGLIGKDGGSHRGQSGIFGAADAYASHQGIATTNYKFIHKTLWRNKAVPEVNPNGAATGDRLFKTEIARGQQRLYLAGIAIRWLGN